MPRFNDVRLEFGSDREPYVKGKALKLVREHFEKRRARMYSDAHIASYFGVNPEEIPQATFSLIIERLILMAAHYIEATRSAKNLSYADAIRGLDYADVFVHDSIHTALAFEKGNGESGPAFIHGESTYSEDALREEVHAQLFSATWTEILLIDDYETLKSSLIDRLLLKEKYAHHLKVVATAENFNSSRGRTIIFATAVVLFLAGNKKDPEAYAARYLPGVQSNPDEFFSGRVGRVHDALKKGDRLVLVQEFLKMTESVPAI